MTASFIPDRAVEFRLFSLFCGLGAGAAGFNAATARLGHLVAGFRTIGGVDVDAAAVADFGRLAGVRGTVLDLFDRPQYVAFHGKQPPAGWREATADDIRAAAGGERPHVVFTSPPCKGFSGLLSERRSNGARYQALNRLTLRGVRLTLEAWADDPPEFFLLENVPRIQTRGRELLDQIIELLDTGGYATAPTTHDCGELGELAQSRRRFLLVARHREKVPPFLYQPPRRRLRGVGEILGAFPLPSHPAAGPMHRMRELQWKTWVRLAFVEAGGDWRSLERLRVLDGHLADYAIAPATEWHRGPLGVLGWDEPAGTITSRCGPTNGIFSVADPRAFGWDEYSQLGVLQWGEPAGTVSGQSAPGGGKYSVADPRYPWRGAHENKMRVEAWDRPAHVITGSDRVGSGALSVADPRLENRGPAYNNIFRVVPWAAPSPAVTGPGGGGTGLAVADPRAPEGWKGHGKYRVTGFDEPAGAVIAASTTGNGAFAVADPRTGLPVDGAYKTAGHYGVVPWEDHSRAVTGTAGHDNGPFNVADPRLISPDIAGYPALPGAGQKLVAVIRSLDGTWHRPFTTLELAALQGIAEPDELLVLEGSSDSAWRERIGNAVPKWTAKAIGCVMARTLLLAMTGETFVLSSEPVWVRQIIVGLTVDVPRLP